MHRIGNEMEDQRKEKKKKKRKLALSCGPLWRKKKREATFRMKEKRCLSMRKLSPKESTREKEKPLLGNNKK